MAVIANFKKKDDKVAEYEVSINNASPQPKGSGADGRAKALAAFTHFAQIAESKAKYLKLLEDLEDYSEIEGSFSADESDSELYIEIIADGGSVYKGYDVDNAEARLSGNPVPNTGRRAPGL